MDAQTAEMTAQDGRRARRNVLRLAIAQALAGANASVIFATGAIIGSTLAPDPRCDPTHFGLRRRHGGRHAADRLDRPPSWPAHGLPRRTEAAACSPG